MSIGSSEGSPSFKLVGCPRAVSMPDGIELSPESEPLTGQLETLEFIALGQVEFGVVSSAGVDPLVGHPDLFRLLQVKKSSLKSICLLYSNSTLE